MHPKQIIYRLIPNYHKIRDHRSVQYFGQWLHEPNLWHLNKRSVAGAVAVGLFLAFVPIPIQMFLAAGAAIILRVNLPISVIVVWVSNPITMPALFYFAYEVGSGILGETPGSFHFELSIDWLLGLAETWRPLLLGCFILGSLSATVGYVAVRLVWRLYILRLRQQRRHKIRFPDK